MIFDHLQLLHEALSNPSEGTDRSDGLGATLDPSYIFLVDEP